MVLEAARSGPMSRPTPGPFDQRQALRPASPATGACAREGRAIPSRQLPRMRHAPIEACRKADGLRFVLDDT